MTDHCNITTDRVSVLTRVDECVTDTFNGVDNAVKLLKEAGMTDNMAYGTLLSALAELRFAAKVLS